MMPFEVVLKNGKTLLLRFVVCRHDTNCRMPWDLMVMDNEGNEHLGWCFAWLTHTGEQLLQYMTLEAKCSIEDRLAAMRKENAPL